MGEGSRFELIPTRIGRVGTQTDAYGPIQAENGDLAFAALRKVDGGYVFSECIAATWHVKRKGPLLRAIFPPAARAVPAKQERAERSTRRPALAFRPHRLRLTHRTHE